MENVITLGKLSPVVFILSPLLSILFLKTPKNTRNELARPVMGTIFLVICLLCMIKRVRWCTCSLWRML